MDTQKQGCVPYDVVRECLKAQSKAAGIPEREGTPEEKEAAKKLADPEGTGKVTKENFIKFIKSGLLKVKDSGL